MPKIIMWGDFNSLVPAFLSINGGKERSISAKTPVSITVPVGTTHIFVSTISKMERTLKGITGTVSSEAGTANAFFGSFEDAIEGDVNLSEDDCLVIYVEQTGLHTTIHNKVVPLAEAAEYVEDFENTKDIDDKSKSAPSPANTNKWLVFVLCLFLGTFGVHRFYEKKIGTGILFLCTFGIVGIGVIVDLIRIARRQA